jgi:tetratricopeptide (TPR) repeat protein
VTRRASARRRQPKRLTRVETRPRQYYWLVLSLVAVVTFAAFVPALQNGFVDWDDDKNFINNASYRGLGWTQLKWMWTTTLLGHWVPVTWMSVGLDYLVWGMDPFGYHLTNVLLHVANAVLFCVVALRLLGHEADVNPDQQNRVLPGDQPVARYVGAATAALVFAVHPLRVESVAWITERRDVLSGLFYLLAVLSYVLDSRNAGAVAIWRRTWYWVSFGSFVLGLLSKAIVLTLPGVLIVLDVFPLRRLGAGAGGWLSRDSRRRLAEKAPFVLASLAVVPITLSAAKNAGNLGSVAVLGLLDRLAISCYGLIFYLRKTLVPLDLAPVYELAFPILLVSAPYLVSGLLVAAITVLAIIARRPWPALAAAWIAYVMTLLPVSGVFQNGIQIAADRYSYLPSLPLAMLAGTAAFVGLDATRRLHLGVTLGLGIAGVIAVLGILTWQQVGVWHDPERLWVHAVATSPSSAAHYNLANLRSQQSRWTEAIEHYQAAASIRPDWENIQVNWGSTLARQGKLDDAIAHYRAALRFHPDNARAHFNWGNALFAAGQLDEAISHYREAVRLEPDLAEVYNNWGSALAQHGKWQEAAAQYREALRVRPNYPLASKNLEQALSRVGQGPVRFP